MPLDSVLQCCKLLASKNYTIAFAESATAGRMCSEFSLSPHSGKILKGGIVSYDLVVKEKILHVPHHLIKTYTPESAEVTKSMAEHSLSLFKSDAIVAISGLTTAGGSETKEKPVGTMFIHIILPHVSEGHRAVYSGSPEDIILQSIDNAASLMAKYLKDV